jgi:hypothetical protein
MDGGKWTEGKIDAAKPLLVFSAGSQMEKQRFTGLRKRSFPWRSWTSTRLPKVTAAQEIRLVRKKMLQFGEKY